MNDYGENEKLTLVVGKTLFCFFFKDNAKSPETSLIIDTDANFNLKIDFERTMHAD